jgi:hypothetical protein
MTDPAPYRQTVAITGEGARVHLATCLTCGAAVMEDDTNPGAAALHLNWHAAQ